METEKSMGMEKINETLPDGKYTYVGVDIDATGRRILDEIVHLSAHTPNDEFDQYIIPVMNLNPAARQRHQLRIITVGFFRMLKCSMTNKVIKSKTEINVLKMFLEWLEQRKAADTDSKGILLIYHEQIKFVPYMLLEAMERYDLLDRFSKTVVGFVNAYSLIETKCTHEMNISSLGELAKNFLNVKDDPENIKTFEGNASVRGRLAYELVKHLAKAAGDKDDITTDLIKDHTKTMKMELKNLSDQKKCMDLQQTFRPIFVQYFKTNLYHRYKAVTFRRVLAEKGFDVKTLEDMWKEKKKDGLTEVIWKLDELKDEEKTELVDILDSYFDPEKQALVPPVKKTTRQRRRSYRSNRSHRNRRSKNRSMNKGDSNEGDQSDDRTSSTEQRSPRKGRSRRKRNQKPNNSPFKQTIPANVEMMPMTQLPAQDHNKPVMVATA